MTLDELKFEAHKLHERLAEKTDRGSVRMMVYSKWRFMLSLHGDVGIVGPRGYRNFHNDDPAKAIKAAHAYITTLPGADHRALTKYRNNLASTLDAAKDDGVDDKFLAGARQSMTAASEALLPAPEGSEAENA